MIFAPCPPRPLYISQHPIFEKAPASDGWVEQRQMITGGRKTNDVVAAAFDDPVAARQTRELLATA